MINAREINEKQFHDAWRGYNQEEVDDFLDHVAEALDTLARENEALKERVAELDEKIESSKASEGMLKKTLDSAQVAAQEAITTARTKAEEIVRDAEERAQRARDELKHRVENAEIDVKRRTEEIEREQEARRRQIQESVDRLEAFESDLKRKLHSFLQQQSAALDILKEKEQPQEVLAVEEPVGPETFDAAVEELPQDPADDLIHIDADEDEEAAAKFDTSDEPSLDDFAPYDEDEAFGPARRRKRGLFRRNKEPEEVSSEEV